MGQIWTDKFFEFGKKYTDADNLFIRAASYFTFGCACMKYLYTQFGFRKVHANMYLLFVAPPNSRKSLWCELALQKISKLIPAEMILPTDFSDEGFDDALSFTKGYGVLYYSEFQEALLQVKSDKAKKFFLRLNDHFDHTDSVHKSITRAGGPRIIDPGTIMSFISAITHDSLAFGLRSQTVTSGNMSRIMILQSREQKRAIFPEVTPQAEHDDLVTLLQQKAPRASQEMIFEREAKDFIIQTDDERVAYAKKRCSDPETLIQMTQRMQQYWIKLAMIVAFQENSVYVKAEHVARIHEEIIRPYLLSCHDLIDSGLHDSEYQRTRIRVIEKLKKCKDYTATQRELMRLLKIPANQFDGIMRDLEEGDYIRIEIDGRSKRYVWKTEQEPATQEESKGFGARSGFEQGQRADRHIGEDIRSSGSTPAPAARPRDGEGEGVATPGPASGPGTGPGTGTGDGPAQDPDHGPTAGPLRDAGRTGGNGIAPGGLEAKPGVERDANANET